MAPLIFQLTSDALAALQLATDPVGWDAIKYLFTRDTKTHGVMLSTSVELTFVKAAAAYLRTVYEGGTDSAGVVIPAYGVEGLVNLTVFEQDPNELKPVEIYRGRVDFTTYASTERGVTARFKETGLATTLLTRDTLPVDLFGNESLGGAALPAYAPVMAALHSQQTLQRFTMEQRDDDTPQAGVVNDTEDSVLFFFGMDTVALNEFGLEPFAIGPESGDAGDPVNVPFLKAKANGVHTFKLRLDTFPRVSQVTGAYFKKIDIKYEFKTIVGGVVSVTKLLPDFHRETPFADSLPHAPDPAYGADPLYHLDTGAHTFTVDMAVGDEAYLYGEVWVHEWSGGSNYVTEVRVGMGVGSYLHVSAPTTTAPTTCAGLLAHEALGRCCEAIADERDALYSEYYGRTDCRRPYAQDGPGAHRLFTSGFQLRGFPLPSAPAPAAGDTDTRKSLTTYLRELYDSLDAEDCLGMGLEQRGGRPVVRIEPRAHFYQPAESLRLGAVTGLKKSFYPELLYNAVEVGYARWQSGAPNGLDEFNAKRTYALPITTIKKTYAAVSPVSAAGYLIEQARRDRYDAASTKEGQADAENFWITLRRTPAAGWASKTNQGFVPGSISGILSLETAYNLDLSPGRMLRKHGPWVRACLAAQTSKRLLLGEVQGNAHLVSQMAGEAAPLNEAGNVPVADLAPPVILSELYDFTIRLRRGEMEALRRAPYGRISFLDGFNQRKSGYLLKAERDPRDGTTAFTLLRAA